jgi:phosphate transport system substrate-binding protein
MKARGLLMTLMGVLTAATFSSCTPSSDRRVTPKASIRIGGSSEGYPVLEILAEAYENQDTEIRFAPSSQSSGGIAGVKDRAIDIGIVSRQLTATENSDNIQYLAIATAPMLLITNESVEEVKNLDVEQIKGIYSGAIANWQELGGPDAEIILLDLPEDENEKEILREHFLGENLKITPTAITFQEGDEILEAVAATSFSIGPIGISKEVEKLPVNVLNINGFAPTVANMKSGKYKLTQTIGIVFLGETEDSTQDFINFIQSEKAEAKLEEAGYIVLSNPKL